MYVSRSDRPAPAQIAAVDPLPSKAVAVDWGLLVEPGDVVARLVERVVRLLVGRNAHGMVARVSRLLDKRDLAILGV